MKTIAINVEKGGAGKTMIACHLAWVLADGGHRVLFLDLDRQCNATDALAECEGHRAHTWHRRAWADRSAGVGAYAWVSQANLCASASCSITTPLGLPVEPEVNNT